MKKRGFTLIELLAVIVILAVVAIITVPMLLKVIEEARINSARVTATNYINALEEQIALNKLKGEEISDGKYEIIEKGKQLQQSQTKARSMARESQIIKMNLKGKLPHKGTTEIKNGRVVFAEFYVGNYKIEYRLDENGNPSINIGKDGQKTSTIDMSLTPITNSIKAIVTCTTEGIENDTYKYKYKIDNGNYIESNSNIHTFNKLKANSKHKITAQCTNSTGGMSETTGEITTDEIDEPTYELDTEEEWASKRTVTITYYGENLKNSYSIDGGETWINVTGNSVEVEFTSEGSIIARTTDGENLKTTSVYKVIVKQIPVYTYEYREDKPYYTFSAPVTGTYKLETWGAQGDGTDTYPGGKGGYTSGKISLKKGEILYFYVGSQYGYNGGGSKNAAPGYGGGGATDVRLVGGKWDDFDSLKSRIMVAAGGGGAQTYYTGLAGGAAGGINGEAGKMVGNDGTIASGATQTNCGTGKKGSVLPSFGKGGAGALTGGGGGGGYYGAYAGSHGDGTVGSGGGGSSYISGYDGCDSISASSTDSEIIHTGNSIHYSNYQFSSPVMKAGNEEMPNYSGNGTMIGNAGRGYAKITYIEN